MKPITSEQDFNTALVNLLQSVGECNAIESHETADGIPDLLYCLGGVEGHIELKSNTGTKHPHIRPSQARWARKWAGEGARVYFICYNAHPIPEVYIARYTEANAPWLKGVVPIKEWKENCDIRHRWDEFLIGKLVLLLKS